MEPSVELRSHFGRQGLLIHAALIAVFGIFLPWMRGIEFLDPVIIAAYACLGVLFAAPAVAQGFALERPHSGGAAIGRIALAIVYGEFVALTILLAGLITVSRTVGFSIGLDVVNLAKAAALGIAASFALSSIAGWIALRFSAGMARMAMRVLFLGLLFLFFFRSGWLPDVTGEGAVVCLGIGAVALINVARAANSTERPTSSE